MTYPDVAELRKHREAGRKVARHCIDALKCIGPLTPIPCSETWLEWAGEKLEKRAIEIIRPLPGGIND
jgi:hypothetical protein